MEEFENFFSQLIPAPDQDIWLLSTSQQIQQQQQNDGVSASGIPVGWSFQNLLPNGTTLNGGIGILANTNTNNGGGNSSGNNNGVMITGLDNNPQIREQLALLQQQQQNQQSQIQQQLQTYQQLQQQQYQQRQQQYQQQYQQPYTTPSPPQDLSPQQPVTLSFNNGNGNNSNGNNNNNGNDATSIQQQIQLQLQVQQFQQQHQQQQQLQAQQEQFQHQALQQAQQQHFQQQAQQQHAQNKQDQQIKQQLHAQQQYQQQIQQQVQNAQQIHNQQQQQQQQLQQQQQQQQQQQAAQQRSQPQSIQTSGSIPLQQQAFLQAQSLMNSILNHDSTPSSSPNTTSTQFLNTPILDQQILSSIKPTYSQIAKGQTQPNNTQHVGFNSSTPHLDDLTGAVDNSSNNGNGKKATKNGKQPKQPKQPAVPKQPKQSNKQKKQTDQIPQQNEIPTTSTSFNLPNLSSDNMGGFEFFEDDDKKKSVNRINQNLASRNYRQRRKEYIKEIESKMASLTFENHQLKKENETLKETGGVEVMRPEPELITMVMEGKQIINQLTQALKKNDDRTLIYLLHLYHCAIAKRYSIVEREVEKIVHPYTQSKLAAMGYIPKSDKMFLNCIAGPASDSWFSLFKNEAEITPDQSLKLEALRVQHGKIDAALIQERQELDLDIKKFYYTKILVLPNNPLVIGDIPAQPYNVNSQSPQNNNSPLEISQLLDFAGKLESLKKNFILHRNLMLDTLASLSSILAPKQEAMLLVRVHAYTSYDFTHMELLKDVWTNIVSSKAVNGPLNIAEALKKMSDTTNTHQTIENIVKPPQFHQYTPKPPTQLKFENQSNSFGINNQQQSINNNSNSEIPLNNINNNTTLPTPSVDAIPYPNPGSGQAKRFQWFNYPSAPN